MRSLLLTTNLLLGRWPAAYRMSVAGGLRRDHIEFPRRRGLVAPGHAASSRGEFGLDRSQQRRPTIQETSAESHQALPFGQDQVAKVSPGSIHVLAHATP